MNQLRPKKWLGQHFLNDQHIAAKIANALTYHNDYGNLVEVGPGMGILSGYLLNHAKAQSWFFDLDSDSVDYLRQKYPDNTDFIHMQDFLTFNPQDFFQTSFGVIGNFPYNISSQILFKVLEHRSLVEEVVGMLQKEVAERITSPPGNKTYGILSVFLQAFYSTEYLFTVEPEVFTPPPKVRSGVIRLVRNEVERLNCNETLFFKVVKQGFQNRRKTLRNALKPLNLTDDLKSDPVLDRRAETLSVAEFEDLTNKIEISWKP